MADVSTWDAALVQDTHRLVEVVTVRDLKTEMIEPHPVRIKLVPTDGTLWGRRQHEAAEPGSEGLLAGLALLRQLNSGDIKALPLDVDTSFVPAAWRGSMQGSHSRRRWTWEIALALALKDALRSGDVFVPDSRRHVSFWKLCYDEPAWQ
jgi:hypothetical protein